MQAQASCREVEGDHPFDLDRDEILKTVTSLREDVCSMTTDIRDVLRENAKLKKEVGRLRERRDGRRHGEQKISEVQRLKHEVDQLVSMYETASAGRTRPQRATRREPSIENGSRESASLLKKMMMFMMIAEMV